MTFLKYFFAAACCSASAAFAAFAYRVEYDVEYQTVPLTWVAPLYLILFALLLIATRRLQARGMRAESWALLAYGSWMIIPAIMLSHVFLERHRDASALFLYSFLLCLLAGFGVTGIRAALRNRWGEIGGWWLGSLPLLILAGLFWIGRFMD